MSDVTTVVLKSDTKIICADADIVRFETETDLLRISKDEEYCYLIPKENVLYLKSKAGNEPKNN